VLQGLVDKGNTVIVIEHNLDVIKNADWIVDMGPEGGNGGGRVIAQGTPEQVALVEDSYTGQFLAPVLARGGRVPSRPAGARVTGATAQALAVTKGAVTKSAAKKAVAKKAVAKKAVAKESAAKPAVTNAATKKTATKKTAAKKTAANKGR
jgi:excinuclease ABC subunit A